MGNGFVNVGWYDGAGLLYSDVTLGTYSKMGGRKMGMRSVGSQFDVQPSPGSTRWRFVLVSGKTFARLANFIMRLNSLVGHRNDGGSEKIGRIGMMGGPS